MKPSYLLWLQALGCKLWADHRWVPFRARLKDYSWPRARHICGRENLDSFVPELCAPQLRLWFHNTSLCLHFSLPLPFFFSSSLPLPFFEIFVFSSSAFDNILIRTLKKRLLNLYLLRKGIHVYWNKNLEIKNNIFYS